MKESLKKAKINTRKFIDNIRMGNFDYELKEKSRSGCTRSDNYKSCLRKMYVYEMLNKGFGPEGQMLTGSTKTYVNI